jgi:arylsulfatase A-like enzyme
VVCGIDLSPTFCALAGVSVDESIKHDGQDMREALLGKPVKRTGPICWQYGKPYSNLLPGNPDFVSPSMAIRDGNWKLLVNPNGFDPQLYDLAADPGERKNLLAGRLDKANELWPKLRQWATDVGLETKAVELAVPRD